MWLMWEGARLGKGLLWLVWKSSLPPRIRLVTSALPFSFEALSTYRYRGYERWNGRGNRFILWIYCRILLKKWRNFVLDTCGDSDFKRSPKRHAQMQKSEESHTFFQVCNTRLVDVEPKRLLVLPGTSKAFCLSVCHHFWARWCLIKGWIQTGAIALAETWIGNLLPLTSWLISSSL